MTEQESGCSCGNPDHNKTTDAAHPEGCACQQHLNSAPLTEEEALAIARDPAAGSLARALGGAFFFLKIGMLVLLLFFILDRFRNVNDGEVMLVKRFGAFLSDEGGIRVFAPGQYHFIWPYPIEEAVILRTSEEKQLDLGGNFWPRVSADAAVSAETGLGAAEELDPDLDGYNITGDLNILHTRWNVKYRINNFRDYLLTSQTPLESLRAICEQAIVRQFAAASVDQVYYGDRQALFDRISEDINQHLARTHIGVELVSLINVSLLPPGKTQEAFDRLTSSLSERKKLIDKARTEANTALKEGETDSLKTRNAALEYQVAIVSRAKSEAARLNELLARFPGDPEGLNIFLEQFRYDRMRQALSNARIYVLREGNNIFWTGPAPADYTDPAAAQNAQSK